VCVDETELLHLFAHVPLLLLLLSFFLGVGAPSLSLGGFMFKAARRGLFSLFVVASAACVYETGLLLLFAYVRVAQYNIIRNTKQIQKQNSIKPNTRTPGKCFIVYYFSRPAGLPVLAVTYNDT